MFVRHKTQLQLIEALCLLCEQMIQLVRKMSLRLTELGDVELAEEIAAANEKYRELIGSGEAPDDAYGEEDEG